MPSLSRRDLLAFVRDEPDTPIEAVVRLGDGLRLTANDLAETIRPYPVRLVDRFQLTPKETELLTHILGGLSNEEISERLRTDAMKIGRRVKDLLRILGVKKRQQILGLVARHYGVFKLGREGVAQLLLTTPSPLHFDEIVETVGASREGVQEMLDLLLRENRIVRVEGRYIAARPDGRPFGAKAAPQRTRKNRPADPPPPLDEIGLGQLEHLDRNIREERARMARAELEMEYGARTTMKIDRIASHEAGHVVVGWCAGWRPCQTTLRPWVLDMEGRTRFEEAHDDGKLAVALAGVASESNRVRRFVGFDRFRDDLAAALSALGREHADARRLARLVRVVQDWMTRPEVNRAIEVVRERLAEDIELDDEQLDELRGQLELPSVLWDYLKDGLDEVCQAGKT